MYRAGLEGILGVQRRGDMLIVDPCIPAGWPGFEVTVKFAQAVCRIEVRAARTREGQELYTTLDGVRSAHTGESVSVPIDGHSHHLLMFA
jgi:cyclic beta-1,2-glucan synthetase